MSCDATVAILLFNGEEYLDDLLRAVFSQKTRRSYEVLVIDSGSSDQSIDIVSRYPKIRLHQIPNKEFGHGPTRNLAVSMAKGKFVLFLTQDAVPSHDGWLDCMLEPFELSDKVGCVLGKQIPRPDCFATLKREVYAVFRSFGDDGAIAFHRKTPLTDQLGITNTFLSDANSAVRKSIAAKVPFRNVSYAEDQALGIDMLENGFLKAYAPLGSVFHSHDYPLGKYFRRKFDECVGLRKSTGQMMTASVRELTLGSLRATMQDYVFIIHDKDYSFIRKLHDLVLAPFYNVALRIAIRMAANQKLSDRVEHKLSLEARARQKAKD
jgi:glycosyltransferase involved in cell wall biosynthesis